MLDRIYKVVFGLIEVLFERQDIRRRAIGVLISIPVVLIIWNPPWFLDAYFMFGLPMLVMGVALLLTDITFWLTRREDEKAATKKEAEERRQSGIHADTGATNIPPASSCT